MKLKTILDLTMQLVSNTKVLKKQLKVQSFHNSVNTNLI